MSPRRQAIVTVAGVILGAALFAYAVSRVGVDALTDGVRRVGWGLAAILALGGARFALRAQCWRWCLPPAVPLDFMHAFNAFLSGDAVGNVTPLGLLASEPTKVLLVRHHLATLDSVASLTLENILYALSVVAMLIVGLALLLATSTIPGRALWTAVTVLIAAIVMIGGVFVFIRSPRLLPLRAELRRLATKRPGRLAQVLSLHIVFHVLAVAETYLILQWLLGDESPTALQAVIFETVNRLTIVVFKFVPFRIGVDEATAGAVAPLLAVTSAVGVTLAVIRKARLLFWAAIGLLFLATHPTRSRSH